MENTELKTEEIYQTRSGKKGTFVVLEGKWVSNSYKCIANPMKKMVPQTQTFIINDVKRMIPNKVSIREQIGCDGIFVVKVPLWLYNKWK